MLRFQGLRTTNDAYYVFLANVLANKITIVDKILAHHRIHVKASLSVTREESWDCCWQAIYSIKLELEKRNYYKRVERSFVNWSVHFLLWNVYTLQGKAKEDLLEAIQQNYSVVFESQAVSCILFL